MDTTCFREIARFSSREQPKSFSIDWILSGGHRKPAVGSNLYDYPQPKVRMRGALYPASAYGPFAAAFGSACVYNPHFYHRPSYRDTEARLHYGHDDSYGLRCTGDLGLKSCRRMRTVFSAEQLQKLEEVFSKQRYMTGSEKVLLASALRLTETQVKVWFQNRRTKWRKSREVEQRANDECSDLKHEACMTEDGEFKDTEEMS